MLIYATYTFLTLFVIYVLFNEYRWYDLGRFFRAVANIGKADPPKLEQPPTTTATPPIAAPAPVLPPPIARVPGTALPARALALAQTPVVAPVLTPPTREPYMSEPRRRVAFEDIRLKIRETMFTKGDAPPMNPTMTYQDIKALRRERKPITLEQFQAALDHQRALVVETAIRAATLSGEHWAQARLMPFTTGDGAPGQGYYDARHTHEKAMRHLSKLVYWYAKAQAGVLYETMAPTGAPPLPFAASSLDNDNDEQEEDEDDESDLEDEEDDDEDGPAY